MNAARETRGSRAGFVWSAFALAAVAVIAIVAVRRGGLLDLPPVSDRVTAETAGLSNLDQLARRAAQLDAAGSGTSDAARVGTSDAAGPGTSDAALIAASTGLKAVRDGEVERGLDSLRHALRLAPSDLVLGNAYRMTVLRLRRAALNDASARATLAGRLPPAIEREPIAFLETLRREHPGREVSLQLALAWVDELMLFPALEIKAPASVESVALLSGILEQEPAYVPALFGRGLNYLHRPARLVWPESKKMAPDAASRDLAQCVAIGRKIGGGSPRLVGTLALTLGDAYAREGHLETARSWWQIAQNTGADAGLSAAARRRFTWDDREVPDRLEQELETRMSDLDHPLSDLAILWQ